MLAMVRTRIGANEAGLRERKLHDRAPRLAMPVNASHRASIGRWAAWIGMAALAATVMSACSRASDAGLRVRVDGTAMRPTLQDGDLLAGRRVGSAADITRGAIVIATFGFNPNPNVKRVIGLPGDILDIDPEYVALGTQVAHTAVLIRPAGRGEWQVLHEPYLPDQTQDPWTDATACCAADGTLTLSRAGRPVTVPADHFFVLGDDRNGSRDSRSVGFVPLSAIMGVVVGRVDASGNVQTSDFKAPTLSRASSAGGLPTSTGGASTSTAYGQVTSADGGGIVQVRVQSAEMRPTLQEGDVLGGRPVTGAADITRGALVVVTTSAPTGLVAVARAIGLPGDMLEIRPGDDVTHTPVEILVAPGGHGSWQRLVEPYLPTSTLNAWVNGSSCCEPDGTTSDVPMPVTLPADSYFLLYDDRASSGDSRVEGFTPLNAIAAVIVGRVDATGRLQSVNFGSPTLASADAQPAPH